MLLLGIRVVFRILLILPGLVECSHKTSLSPTTTKSNLLDLKISNSLHFLLSHFDQIDDQISLENGTNTVRAKATTIRKKIHVATTTIPPRSNDCGAKVTALTNIVYSSPFASVQYWLLKPKLQLLRTFTGTRADEFGGYREVVMRKDQHMIIAYEFPSARPDDCSRLVEFSRKIVSYGKGDVPRIIVKCDCERTYYYKLV